MLISFSFSLSEHLRDKGFAPGLRWPEQFEIYHCENFGAGHGRDAADGFGERHRNPIRPLGVLQHHDAGKEAV